MSNPLIGYITAERSMMVEGAHLTTAIPMMPEAKRLTVRCRPAVWPLPDVPRSYVFPSRPSVGAVTVRVTKSDPK